jgi:TolA-binding protein
LIFFFTTFVATGQKTAAYDEPDATYRAAMELYGKSLFGAAKDKFVKTISMIDDEHSDMRISAEYYNALCAVELFNDDAELLLRKFINDHPQSTYIRKIYFQLGKFQYRKKSYRNVIKSFEKVDVTELSKEEQAEYYFKKGYSFFKRKKYEEAKKAFFEIRERDNKYKNLAVYYYSHIAYLDHNYETALKGFLTLKEDEDLQSIIPYYIVHIYYMQGRYDELLNVAQSLLDKSVPQRKDEIARLIGEAYYNTNRYDKAIPYLEMYYRKASPTPAGQYQLGYAYYMTGDYKNAINYLKHVGGGADSLAQNANYHLALCYLKEGKKNFALTSFRYAYLSNADPQITEDALYNYAKLSYELSYNPYNQAIEAFNKYLNDYPQSPHRQEIMEYLTKMYLSTRNYKQAKASIEKIKNRSPEMNAAYQRILFALGVDAFNNGKYEESVDYFNKAAALRYHKQIIPKSLYWRAEAYYRMGQTDKAIAGFKEFLVSPGAISLPYFNRANYNIAYAWFSKKNWDEANVNFRIFIRNEKDTGSLIMNDAYLRIADCYFMRKQLTPAIEYYDKAIALGKTDADYAYYKKAEALGALGDWKGKAQTFEALLKAYPQSDYSGNAELALAKTYFNALNIPQKAVDHYKHIIDTYPPQKNFVKKAMLDLGLVYSNMGEDEKAIEVWKKVNENYRGTQESKEALDAMREAYISLNRVDDFFSYVKSLGIKPPASQQDSATYLAAEAIYMKGDCDRSSQGFMEYLTRFPAGAFITNAHFYLADCEFRASHFDKALTDYSVITAMPVSPFSEGSWERVAYIYYHKKEDYSKALEAYRALLQIAEYKANIETAKIGIMRSLWNLGDTTAVIDAAKAVAAIPNIDNNIKNEALMITAKANLTLGNDSLSIEALNQIIKNTTSELSAEARFILAEMAFEAGDYDKSESIVYDIIQQEPSYEYWVAKALVLSADIFMKTDNEHQAVATLESIINGYDGDKALLEEAKAKLEAIKNKDKKEVKSTEDDNEMIIDLNKDLDDSSLFELNEEEEETDEGNDF